MNATIHLVNKEVKLYKNTLNPIMCELFYTTKHLMWSKEYSEEKAKLTGACKWNELSKDG
jgi:hypothetical protein